MGRYLLFGVIAIESLALPYFLSKDIYGEVEFYKYSAFLAQFGLLGAGTGYVVGYLNGGRSSLTNIFIIGAIIQSILVGLMVGWFSGSWIIAILSVLAILALVFESIIKTREKYLLAMSFKPMLSVTILLLTPLIIFGDIKIQEYVLLAFVLATVMYIAIVSTKLKTKGFEITSICKPSLIKSYVENIKTGFVLNVSTALMFLFFFIDRAIVRDRFPELLGDYSLSFSIMQLTVVAITAFSYVNIVEFGKQAVGNGELKKYMIKSLKKCFLIYIVIGIASIIIAYAAEQFYQYGEVFETTLLMVVLFGFASTLSSLNAAHVYLGSVNIMTAIIFSTLIVSCILNLIIPLNTASGYYLLLSKTYGLYLLFSILSFIYICRRLHVTIHDLKVKN